MGLTVEKEYTEANMEISYIEIQGAISQNSAIVTITSSDISLSLGNTAVKKSLIK